MNRLCFQTRLAALVFAAGLLAGPVAAQPNAHARPLQTVSLAAGFSPDPHSVTLAVGGADRNAISGNGCAGYINNAQPTLTLNYTAGQSRLAIYVDASMDTTLLVYDASGTWHCSDDYDGSNPAVILDNPASGAYAIWVGTYTQDAAGQRGTIHLSERVPRR